MKHFKTSEETQGIVRIKTIILTEYKDGVAQKPLTLKNL